jgi:EAL domain-containing protein (putative c-di-GMP-specific phosphodiesterase class I)
VVAEGLQDRAAETVLIEAGCDAAQGFLVGKPTAEREMTQLLLAHSGLAKQLD